ncbi:MAG TPA: hypothetical protein VE650_06000 [Acetobacteraceae bacterium]|nr:hypothetical protein [Acetobacteraceae bacterium]
MRLWIAVGAALVFLSGAAGAADPVAECRARHAEVSKKAQSFTGDAMMKRLIEADLRRAASELLDGDAPECMEALDHATKLLAGDV